MHRWIATWLPVFRLLGMALLLAIGGGLLAMQANLNERVDRLSDLLRIYGGDQEASGMMRNTWKSGGMEVVVETKKAENPNWTNEEWLAEHVARVALAKDAFPVDE